MEIRNSNGSVPQASEDGVEREASVAAECDDTRLIRLGEDGALGLAWTQRDISGAGPRPLLCHCFWVQPVAGGQGAGACLRRLELGSNTRGRLG